MDRAVGAIDLDRPGPLASRERRLVFLLILGGLLLRIPHLTQGLVEFHGWRQADGAMVARNLVADGFDLLHPRIDWVADLPGHVGMELPLVPLLTSLLYAVFGEHLLLGRLVSLAFLPPSSLLLYLLIRIDFGARVASATLFVFLTAPLAIFYSRTLMPESAMLCAMLAALYFARRWSLAGRERDFRLAVASAAMAMLLKLPAGVVLLPMALAARQRLGPRFLRSIRPWAALLAALAGPALWYAHAGALARAQEPFHFFGEENWLWATGLGVLADPDSLVRLAGRSFLLIVTPLAAAAAPFGLAPLWRSPARHFYLGWIGGLLFATLLGWRGQVYHEYYQLALVPACALLAALGAARLARGVEGRPAARRAALAGAAALQLALGVALAETRYLSERCWHLWHAGLWVGTVTPAAGRLAVADGGDPVLIYASGKRGWHFPGRGRAGEDWRLDRLLELRARGATHFVALRRRVSAESAATPLRRWVRGRLGIRADDPVAARALLENHPDFERELLARFPAVAESELAVVFDLLAVAPASGSAGEATHGAPAAP